MSMLPQNMIVHMRGARGPIMWKMKIGGTTTEVLRIVSHAKIYATQIRIAGLWNVALRLDIALGGQLDGASWTS